MASAHEEWESKAKVAEMNLGSVAAKFDAGLAGLTAFRRQQVQQGQVLGLLGCGNGFTHGGVVRVV